MEITIDDVLRSFGASSLPDECVKFLNSTDFSYEVLEGEDKENAILSSLRKIREDKQAIGSPERVDVWNKGWEENLNAFRESGDLNDVVPKFIRPNGVIRFDQKFIRPNDPYFERNYCRLFQMWLFKRYMGPFDSIYEFGCGSGFNLIAIADMFPDKKLIGTDFVCSSIELVNEIAKRTNFNMSGHFFDMLNPDRDFNIPHNSCVLTFGAMEQLAGKFHDFIEYLIHCKVGRCIHVEPTKELYDSNSLIDYLAIAFHEKRGYSEGLLPHLRGLHNKSVINLLKVHRLRFGNGHMEGYNYLIWETM